MIIISTKSGSRYEVQQGRGEMEQYMFVTRVSDSVVYNLNSSSVIDDINSYLAYEEIFEMEDPPMIGHRWVFHTQHGRLQTSEVTDVVYARDEAVERLRDALLMATLDALASNDVYDYEDEDDI